MRFLAALLLFAAPALAEEAPGTPPETPIEVPSPIPSGFLLAWKPSWLSVRIDSGAGAQFGSDKLQPLRLLGRYTTTVLHEQLMFRAEIEGGRFQTDQQGVQLGTDGYDVTARFLFGTATHISPAVTITATGGVLTRYQRGRAEGGAPELGLLGLATNFEVAYRLAPVVTVGAHLEAGLTPIPYLVQKDLGVLSDASELKARFFASFDLTTRLAVEVGYDFTRWHASFSGSPVLANTADRALLIETRDHALTLGVRLKP